MPLIVTRSPRTRQPQTKVGVNWANQLSRGLVWSGTPVETVGGEATRIDRAGTGAVWEGVGGGGRAWSGAGTAVDGGDSRNYYRVGRTPALAYTDEVTFEAVVLVRSFQTSFFPYISGVLSQFQSEHPTNTTSFWGPALRFNNDATLGNAAKPLFMVQQGGTEISAVGSNSLSTGRRYHMLGTVLRDTPGGSTGTVALYIDGAQVASTAITGAFDNHPSNWVSVLSDYSAYGPHARLLAGDIYLARIYNRGMSALEARELARLPWQLFAPIERRIWVPGAGGGGSTFTATLTANLTASAAIKRAAASSKSASASITAGKSATTAATKTGAATASASKISGASAAKTATTTATASAVRRANATRSASSAVGVALSRAMSATRSASITLSAALGTVKAKLLTLAASVTSSATVRRAIGATRAATSTAAGTLAKAITAAKAASTAIISTVGKAVATTKSASIAATATIATVKAKLLTLVASLSVSGSITKTIKITRSGAVSLLALLERLFISGGGGPAEIFAALTSKRSERNSEAQRRPKQ